MSGRSPWLWLIGLVVLPFLVSAVVTAIGGADYKPIADYALTELRIRDVAHLDVLTGLYSRSDWSHPGPLLFIALAPFYWLTGGASVGMNLGALAINALSVAGIAWISWRRGGVVLLLCALLACALVMRTMGADFLYDPWNNYVVTLPFGLLLFCIWSLAAGDRWVLPIATVVASFLAQTHVGFVLLALPLLALGTAWLVLPVLRRGTDGAERARVLWMVAGCAALGMLLWSPVIVDVIANRGSSNLERTYRYFTNSDDGTHTLASGWRVVSSQFGIPPEWLTSKRTDVVAFGESPFVNHAPFPFLLALVVIAGVLQWVRRRADEARVRYLAVVLGATFCLGVIAVTRTLGPALDYRLRWTWMPPLVGFVLVVATAWQLLVHARPQAQRVLVPGVAVLVGVVTAINLYTAATVPSPWKADSDIIADLAPKVIDDLEPPSGQIVVNDRFATASWYARGLALQLERAGFDLRAPRDQEPVFGEHRVVDDSEPIQAQVVVALDDDVQKLLHDPTLRLIARWRPDGSSDFARALRERARLQRAFAAGRLTRDQYTERAQEVLRGPPHVPLSEDIAVVVERTSA